MLMPLMPDTRFEELGPQIGAWSHLFSILSKMTALHELRIHMYISISCSEEPAQNDGRLKMCERKRLLNELDELKKGKKQDNWTVFDVTVDRKWVGASGS